MPKKFHVFRPNFSTRRLLSVVGALTAPVLALACSEEKNPPAEAPQSPAATDVGSAAAPPPKAANATPAPATTARAPDAGPYEGPYVSPIAFQALIVSEMEWPSEGKKGEGSRSVRLGYIRQGEKAPAIGEPHKKSNCSDGWYQLLAGGFVCGKYVTTDMNHPKVKLAHGPDLSGPLPYTYGVNGRNGTPLYRHVPSREQRLANEPWLQKPKKKTIEEEALTTASLVDMATLTDAGLPSPPGITVEPNLPSEEDKPWYMRDHDGGPPPITLEELKETGIVARRMIKGFYLSLDRQFTSNGTKWWKTNDGLVTPADRVWVAKPATDYHGVWLGQPNGTYIDHEGGTSRQIDKLPVGFVLSRSAHKYTISADRKRVTAGERLYRFGTVGLTGEVTTIGGTEYWETDEGWWLRARDGTKTEPGPAPDKLGANEKWIDVNLKRQTLVAFEGDKPVFATLFSSGRKDHETPPGSFRIREKHIAATMDGDADTASDGPYSIQDVPYIQYFNAGYALHGAFWHAEFGRVKSHGCVNLSPWDSKALFAWTEPALPEGWHGVVAGPGRPGTRVVVR